MELTRITVNLIPKADTALSNLMARTNLNRTDIVNRALQLYDYIDECTDNGEQLLVGELNGPCRLIKVL